jgi:hypothetical protein
MLVSQTQCATQQTAVVVVHHDSFSHCHFRHALSYMFILLQRQQVAAQKPSPAPVPPWCELHLYCLCRATGGVGSQRLYGDGYLWLLAASRRHAVPTQSLRSCQHSHVMRRTPSFCDTASATRDRLWWFVQSTQPNFVMVSPILRPAVAAGLPSTTLLTFAKGASRAAGGALKPACAWAAAAGLVACSARRAWCSWRPFSMRDMRPL